MHQDKQSEPAAETGDRTRREAERLVQHVVRRALRHGSGKSHATRAILELAKQLKEETTAASSSTGKRVSSAVAQRIVESLGSEIARRTRNADEQQETVAIIQAAISSSA